MFAVVFVFSNRCIDFYFYYFFIYLLLFFYYFQPLNGLASESDNVWPSIPVPQTAPIPICNGCGTSSDGMMLMPSSLGKTVQKYGE